MIVWIVLGVVSFVYRSGQKLLKNLLVGFGIDLIDNWLLLSI
jgi:hypothetical protein